MTAATQEEIRVGEMTIRFLLEGEQSAGSVAVFEAYVPAGSKIAAAHSHDGYEETIYGLEGTLAWTVEDEAIEVGPGEVLCIPRGAVHQFANTGEADAKALAIATPGVIGPSFFREVAAIIDAATDGPPDVAAIGAVMLRHGLTPAGARRSGAASHGSSRMDDERGNATWLGRPTSTRLGSSPKCG